LVFKLQSKMSGMFFETQCIYLFSDFLKIDLIQVVDLLYFQRHYIAVRYQALLSKHSVTQPSIQ